jgi:diguanylate cyclase (GGDEF)-like protein
MNIRIVMALFLLSALSLHASAEFEIGIAQDTRIGQGLQFLEDESMSLSIDSIKNSSEMWQVHRENVFNQGYSKSNWWIKFEVVNKGAAEHYFMEVSYPVLDYLDVYVEQDNKIIAHHAMGDKLSFHERPIQHRLFLTPLDIEPGQTQTVYIRVQSTSSIQVPIAIWQVAAYQEADITMNAIHGIYIGGMLVIGIYNLLVFLALRDRSYFYYVCYVFSMLLFLASLNGWTFQYLWPESKAWNDTAILFFLNSSMLFAIVFARHFLDLRDINKSLDVQAKVWIALGSIGFFAYLWLPYNIAIRVLIPFAAFACLWTLSAGVFAWLKGHRSAGIYVISWSGLLIGGVLLALNKLQIIPKNIITDQSVQLGSLLEVMLLSFALAQRINHERTRRILAQQEALEIQRLANEQLEENVAMRTQELELANLKLKEISDTDQLTGLKNRRFLDLSLEHEFRRAMRYKHPVSILIIDIDLFKSINDTYGHLIGDECIKEVAVRFSSLLRAPTDVAARYGGEEFCVILPETSLDGALTVAERIRKTIHDKKFEAEGFSKTLSVSVGVFSKIPDSNDSITSFLDKSDKALYTAKQNGRNRVEYFSIGALG